MEQFSIAIDHTADLNNSSAVGIFVKKPAKFGKFFRLFEVGMILLSHCDVAEEY
jgi:hypothetical protein